jgi:hypothetical protein
LVGSLTEISPPADIRGPAPPASAAADGRASPWIAFRYSTFTVVWTATVVGYTDSKAASHDSFPGTELQNATLYYKRGPQQECISHDDVQAASSFENDLMKLLGRVKGGHREPLNEEPVNEASRWWKVESGANS